MTFFQNLSKDRRSPGKMATDLRRWSINGDSLPIAVRENARARRLTMRLDPKTDGLKITVPPGTPRGAVESFLERHAGWVRARLAEKTPICEPAAGATIPFEGLSHIVQHHKGRGTTHIRIGDLGPEIHVFGDGAHLARRLRDFLKREARSRLEALSLHHAAAIGR